MLVPRLPGTGVVPRLYYYFRLVGYFPWWWGSVVGPWYFRLVLYPTLVLPVGPYTLVGVSWWVLVGAPGSPPDDGGRC